MAASEEKQEEERVPDNTVPAVPTSWVSADFALDQISLALIAQVLVLPNAPVLWWHLSTLHGTLSQGAQSLSCFFILTKALAKEIDLQTPVF